MSSTFEAREGTHGALPHAIDRLVIGGRRLFGWGWAADATRAVKSVHLRLEGEGWTRRLAAGFGLAREDVREAHPQLVNADASGFVVTGFIPESAPGKVWLEVEFDDGTARDVDVTHAAETRSAGRRKWRVLAWIAHSVWRRLKRGDLAGILRRAKAQSYAAPSLDDMGIVARLLPALRAHDTVCIVFDHNMGGGANQYCRGVVAERLAAGQAVVVCTYNLPMLEYRLHLNLPGREPEVFRISTFLVLERLLERVPRAELFVNSPVSFDEPLVLAEWLARMRSELPGVRLTMTAHDYFSVCPSFVLLNADGRYCGIPEISECASCLKRHEASYVALSPPTEIGPWRALWGACLQAADEIRCFSESTRRHLLRAYPFLENGRISVVPHRVDYVPARAPRFDPRAPLVVGIVGEISPQKGAMIVQEMVSRIDRDHPEVRVVVLGTLHAAHDSPRLTVTGAYRREDLVELVESHGINMFLFPSIWPETFSYVVAEMIALGLPIVAFDLGAPGERLRGHRNARLCKEVSAKAALATLLDFHRRLALERASAA
ncbi:MAG TPA: glycosyltransferase [Usitatibacter sp.]|nr:glycosyltransferase [Usitatibacter sp.]